MIAFNSTLARLKRGHMIFALLLMAQFQLWDAVVTQVFTGCGLAREGNILMSGLVNAGDFIAFKVISVAVMALALIAIFRHFPRMAIFTAASVAIFYLGAITWNFTVVFSNII